MKLCSSTRVLVQCSTSRMDTERKKKRIKKNKTKGYCNGSCGRLRILAHKLRQVMVQRASAFGVLFSFISTIT